nr:hypothetical protein [uncultured Cetobacterium sp.]
MKKMTLVEENNILEKKEDKLDKIVKNFFLIFFVGSYVGLTIYCAIKLLEHFLFKI